MRDNRRFLTTYNNRMLPLETASIYRTLVEIKIEGGATWKIKDPAIIWNAKIMDAT